MLSSTARTCLLSPLSKARIGGNPVQEWGKQENQGQGASLVATALLIASVSPGQRLHVTPDVTLRHSNINLVSNQGCSWKLPPKVNEKHLPKRQMGLVSALQLVIVLHLSLCVSPCPVPLHSSPQAALKLPLVAPGCPCCCHRCHSERRLLLAGCSSTSQSPVGHLPAPALMLPVKATFRHGFRHFLTVIWAFTQNPGSR